MAITTTEYANFTKKAFFDNREWLNQENWQMYFGGSLPSGVLVKGKLESSGIDYTSALSRQVLNSSYIQFRAGSILANGIFASYNGGDSIPVIKSADVDRLFVARVHVTAGNVKIVGMTKVASEYGYTPAVFAKMLLQDESLACTRDATYYDIPLLYEVFGANVYDLRRLIYLAGQSPDVDISFSYQSVTNTSAVPGILYGRNFVQIYGGMNYNVEFASADTATYFSIYPNPSCSEKSSVVKLTNNSSSTKQIRIPLKLKLLTFSYSWLESWDVDPNSNYLYKELVSGDVMTLVFTQNGHGDKFEYTVTNKSSATGGSGVDPEDYFTKQEISAQMLLKANVSDMNDALALKENISNLGSLAYLNSANYVTQVTNKPTLGALAAKDTVNVSNEVTGILPIANGGTGANNLASIIANFFANKTYYVSASSGSNDNDGSQGHPFATIQYAIDNCGYCTSCTIHVEGTFAENLTINFGKKITISGTFTLNGYILVDGGFLELKSTGSVVITANNIKGTIVCKRQGVILLTSGTINSDKSSLAVINTYSSGGIGIPCGLRAEELGIIRYSDLGIAPYYSSYLNIAINAVYGMGAMDGGDITVNDSRTTFSGTTEQYKQNGGTITKL